MASNISNNPEYIEMIKFLIERTKDAKSPLSIRQIAEEFKTNSGSSQAVSCWLQRITTFRSKIHRMDSIDTEAKVIMLLALGGAVDMDFLNELRKDAVVEVDENNRITKYRANDGSLELEGDHSLSAKMKDGWRKRKMGSEKSQKDSDDEPKGSTPKTPGSTKRAAARVPNSSKKARSSSAPDDSARIPEVRARELVRCLSAPPTSPRIQQHPQPKQERMTPGAPTRQEVPGATRTSRAHIPRATPIKTESEANEAYTPQIKFLETIQFLILNVEMPILSALQTKIEKKLRESPDAKIPNDVMIPAMELMIAKIAHHSVSNLSENVDSVTLSNFLCYLKAAILYSKLEGLETLLEKIKKKNKALALRDKRVSVEKVASFLQDTLNNVGF